MKIVKENGRYYVNDLDLKEVLANRKYVIRFVNDSIEEYKDMIRRNPEMDKSTYNNFKGKIQAYELIAEKLKLRR